MWLVMWFEQRLKSLKNFIKMGQGVDLSNTVYQYIKVLLNKEQIENWRCICQWLEEAGYKNQIVTQSNQSIPVDAKVHISNINIEGEKLKLAYFFNYLFPYYQKRLKKISQVG